MKKEKLIQFYREMLRIRKVEEKIAELYPEEEIRCPVHFCIGQEAVPVAVAATLEKDDYVLSNHRSHGHYLAKGGDLKGMMAELYGKVTGCTRGKGGSMHLLDASVGFLGAAPIVTSTIPIAVGTAMAAKMRGEKRVTIAFFGEAATEGGAFHESINFAQLKKLPIVFVCENNLYSVYSPLSVRQPKEREVFEIAKGHGMMSRQANGNDVEEAFAYAQRAVQEARRGKGPVFLEFSTYRWLEHCGPNYDNHIGYRTEKEFLKWKKFDPIARFEKKLFRTGILTKQKVRDLVRDIDSEID